MYINQQEPFLHHNHLQGRTMSYDMHTHHLTLAASLFPLSYWPDRSLLNERIIFYSYTGHYLLSNFLYKPVVFNLLLNNILSFSKLVFQGRNIGPH